MRELAVTAGAGGGSDPATEPLSLASLEGTWFGLHLDFYSFHQNTFEATIDGAGNVSDIRVDGTPSGGAGTVTHISDQGFMLSIGPDDMAMGVDPTAEHATLVTDANEVIVWQKGASALMPPYADAHVQASAWGGLAFTVDASMNFVGAAQSSLSVAGGGTYTGAVGTTAFSNDPGSQMMVTDEDTGWYLSEYMSDEPDSGVLWGLLSPDKTFLAGFALSTSGRWPEDTVFFVWTRQ